MFDSLLSWLPWVAGGGVVSYAVMFFFFPSVLPVIAEYLKALSPLVKGAAEGIVEYGKALWAGLLDMLDNAKSVIFVVTVAALSAFGGYQYAHLQCAATIADLRRDYTFVKKKYVRAVPSPQPAPVNPFDFTKWF